MEIKELEIKIVTGFSEEQKYSVGADEAHKAYYLFLHPNSRGVFNDGLALVGKNIQAIEPDYQATMGWNKTHKLDDFDWNELRGKGVDTRLRDILSKAREVSKMIEDNPRMLERPLDEILKNEKTALLGDGGYERYVDEKERVFRLKPKN